MTPDDAASPSPDVSASTVGLPDDAARPGDTGTVGMGLAGQRVVAVVPLRDGTSGKSRLAVVLDPAERSRLIGVLARHVVGTLLASDSVERVLVVTSDPRFTWRALGSLAAPAPPRPDPAPPTVTTPPAEGDAQAAEGDGPARLQIVLQPASRPGLNAALDVGREIVTSDAEAPGGFEASTAVRLLIAHADLPALTAEDVEALVVADAPVVIATDRGRSGTNLLVLDADLPFTFRFGPGSRAAHEAEAETRGVSAVVVQRVGTAVDLDTLDDWSELPPNVRSREDLSALRRAMDQAGSASHPPHVSERA